MIENAGPTIILILAGVLYLLIVGVILKRRGFREWAVRLLCLYLVVSSLWTLGQAFARLGWLAFLAEDALARVLLYGLLLLSLLFLQLNRSFLRIEGIGWSWWALGIAWTAAVVVLNEDLLALPEVLSVSSRWSIQRQGLGFGALVFGWGALMGGAALLTAMVYRQTQQPLHRNRITYWSIVLGLTIVGAVLFFSGHGPLGSSFHLLGTLSAAYVVLTHRLPDVRQMARRAMSYLIITLSTAIIFTASLLMAYYVFQAVPGYSPWLTGPTLALVLAIFSAPLLRLVQRLVDRLISETVYDSSSTLREYSGRISNILDLKRLAAAVIGLISEAMGIQRGALLVVHYEGGENGEDGDGSFRLRGVIGKGEDLLPGVLSAKNPVADYLRRENHPLTQYDIDLLPRFQETPPAESAWLSGLDMDVYVPIYAKEEWIGLLAVGPKASGDRYFDDDLILLSTLADQTALALENARLFEDLKNQNAENERLNEELTVANRELARLDQAKSDFISIASHELRTPLTLVRGYTDILSEMVEEGSLTPDSGREKIDGIRKAFQRLQEIMDTMFDVSRLDTETLSLSLSSTSMASVIDKAVDTWAEGLEGRDQTLTVDGLENLPPITADGKQLTQVFSHLIQNAIKYTPDGGQIRITGRLLDEGMLPQDHAVEVVVCDTGIGIAPDNLERIFDKFYRAGDIMLHSTGRTKFKGAGPGLGLTIARGIVEAHGGRIWAQSPGHDERSCPGSEFHVVLPVQPSDLKSAGVEGLIAAVRGQPRPDWEDRLNDEPCLYSWGDGH